MTSLGPEGTLCYHMCWGCVWYVGVCFCRVACLLLAVRAQLSQNSWRRFLRDLADSWRVRAPCSAPFLNHFLLIFGTILSHWGVIWASLGLGARFATKVAKKNSKWRGLAADMGPHFGGHFGAFSLPGLLFWRAFFTLHFGEASGTSK